MNTWRQIVSRRTAHMLLTALIAISAPLAANADRVQNLRDAAIQADAATNWDQRLRAPELRAFAEALDPIADSYFTPETRAAATDLRKACAAMDHQACTDLADAYESGDGTWSDVTLARSLALITCELGHVPACEHLNLNQGHLLSIYNGPDPSTQAFTRGCAANNADHCYILAFRQNDDATRKAILGLACDLGHLQGCNYSDNWDQMIATATEKCAANDPEGCETLAIQYYLGQHVEKDFAKSRELREQACYLGKSTSCGALASDFRTGRTGPVNAEKAIRFTDKACALDGAYCWSMAKRFWEGTGVEKDEARARTLAHQAVIPALRNTRPVNSWKVSI